MPITLGCPSCGKRFRARDESAGKRVKCPYCQAAVPVPTAEESAAAGAPTAPLPPPPPAFEPDPLPPPRPGPSRQLPRPKLPDPPVPVVAGPDDWGALPGSPAATAPVPPIPVRTGPPKAEVPEPVTDPEPNPFPAAAPSTRDRAGKGKPRPKPVGPEPKKTKPEKSPDEVLARAWASVRRGLFWVQFALFFVALLGFVGFGKALYVRNVGELPKGEGWVQIDGYINSGGPNSIPLTKTDEINLATYGLLSALAGFFLMIGRLFSSGGPRNSGARGLFALSGLLTLVAFVAVPAVIVCERVPFPTEAGYAKLAVLVAVPLAEFWFLTAITASGLALKRPRVARQVGFIGFLVALVPVLATVGVELYVANLRPKKLDADWMLYEQAALLMGWLILVFAYMRAVGGVRSGAREFIRAVEDRDDAAPAGA
ncbi:MAG TPA: hypothetical protein VGE74_21090 [Gemmata sp.]